MKVDTTQEIFFYFASESFETQDYERYFLCFFRLACFRFAAGKAASPMVHDVKQSKSVAYARAVKGPALFVDEPSEQSKSVADARAVEGLCFFRLACFRFAAVKAASPVVHGVKQSKSVAEARAVEGPVLFVDEPSELSKSVVDARAVEGPALSVDEPIELSKSVADARAVESPALCVDEPSELSRSVADAPAVCSPGSSIVRR